MIFVSSHKLILLGEGNITHTKICSIIHEKVFAYIEYCSIANEHFNKINKR